MRIVMVLLCLSALAWLGWMLATSAAVRTSATADSPSPSTMPAQPVGLTIGQRKAKRIPGFKEELWAQLGDITGGRVTVTVARPDGTALLEPVSLSTGESARFKVGSAEYQIVAKELRNHLVGDDSAVLAVAPAAGALSEAQKVEHLIDHVAGLKGAVFLRNGGEHTPAEAAEHLRTKWQRARDQAPTARDFIEGAANRSSLSGEAYRIRLSDGRIVLSRDLLMAELERIETKSRSGR